MPSEERIRAEVQRLADSVVVASDEHLAALLARTPGNGRTRSRRLGGTHARRWVVPLVAAVSVAGVVMAGTVLTRVLPDGHPDVDRAAPVVANGTPDGTVPSVFGHTRDSARALLEDRGLEVRFREQSSCEPAGRPVGTEPVTGAQVQPGETVTVLLAYQGPAYDCSTDFREPWRFVDFATGRGPAPRFSGQVGLFVDGVRSGSLSGADAARGDWGTGSALEILAEATEQVVLDGGSYRAPSLQVTMGTPPDAWCGVARPTAVGDREALALTVGFTDLPTQQCPVRVALYETGGKIDTVVAWSGRAATTVPKPIPDVVGLDRTEARARVTAAGYTARIEELQTCHPRTVVVEQAPTQQALEEDGGDNAGWTGPVTLVVEVPHTTRPCGALDTAASAFLRFARGGPPPVWAAQVKQLLGYTPWASVAAAQADDPATWAFCSGIAPADCNVSPLVVAGNGDVETGEFSDVTRWPDGQVCELIDRGGLPAGLAQDKQIVLYPARVTSCDDEWSVWLWIDDAGRISALNLLVPRQ